jgi:Fe-S-cluster containining protein
MSTNKQQPETKPNNFDLNRAIAYQGSIGEKRRKFCIDYIRHKQSVYKTMEQEIVERVKAAGETITCQKGCSFCCVVYIEASIRECEAIVYYLYQNENILSQFYANYVHWRQQLTEYGDLFKRCEQALNEMRNTGHSEEIQQAVADVLFFYKMQNIACPFLDNRACLIHEVRPYTCAAHFVTTPAELCDPYNPDQPKVYIATIPDDLYDTAFYYQQLSKAIITFMPIAVYEILEGGFMYLSRVTGLESLNDTVMNELEGKG